MNTRLHNNENLIREYALIVESANEAIISLTCDGLIKSWNKTAETIYHYPSHEIIGKSCLCLVSAEDTIKLQALLQAVMSGSSITQYELTLRDKQGIAVDTRINASPIKNKLGSIIGMVILAQNYTQQKRSELQAAIQLNVASLLAESSNLHNATQSILNVICDLLNFTEGEIWALDPEEQVLRYVANWSSTPMTLETEQIRQNMTFHRNEGLPGYVWVQKEPWWSHTLEKDLISTHGKWLTSKNINCCFGFPMLFDEDILGVLLFYGANLEKPEPSLLAMFKIIGKQIGNFFKHRRLEKELLDLAQHDALTGLVNKYYTEGALKNTINTANQDQTIVAFLYFDLDHFKNINDSLGHSKGDLVLQEVARRLKKNTRDGDIIARFGGDEFAIILSGIKKKAHIDFIAKKILRSVEVPFLMDNKEFYLSASMGISVYPDNGDDIEMLLQAADSSMYKVKQSGRNSYLYATSWLNQTEQNLLALDTKLHQAAQHNEFILHYQPIVNIQTNTITGIETLVRWKIPNNGIISPENFITQLEQTNLIISVGQWILRMGCKQMTAWKNSSLHSISVNISVRQLNDQLIPTIKNILNETGLNPGKLILEVTESILMHQTFVAMDILHALNELGIRIAIDDFGTGYSSFAYLKNFKIHILKIDQSFIADLGKTGQSESIITAIIVMAHALGLKTVAEGVETKAQLDFLKEHGCDEYQGFYYSKPLPPDELEARFFPV